MLKKYKVFEMKKLKICILLGVSVGTEEDEKEL